MKPKTTLLAAGALLIACLLPACGAAETEAEVRQTSLPEAVTVIESTAAPEKTMYTLESVRIVTDADFFTYDGDNTYYPEYDAKGRLLRINAAVYSEWELCITPELIYGTIMPGIDEYEYNDDDSIKCVTRRNEDGEVRFTVDYSYNDDGTLAVETLKNGDSVVTNTYEYAEDGKLSSVTRDLGHKTVSINAAYDDQGRLKGLRYKETMGLNEVYNKSSVIHYNKDGTYSTIDLSSIGTMDESTSFRFRYNGSGEMEEVKFSRNYYNIKYTLTYNYGDVTIPAE